MPRLARLCLTVITITTLGASSAAGAQGIFLPSQQSGIGVAAAVSNNQDATAVSIGGGYSWKAFIDGGVFVHRYGYSTDEVNLSAIGVQPYAMVHLLRQSDRIPASVSALGNFQKYFFSSDNEARDVDGYSFFLGGSSFRRFGLGETTSVTPQVTLGYNFLHTNGAVGLVKTKPDDGTFAFQGAVHLAYQAGGPIWALSPYVTVDSTYLTFGLTLGATFPLGAKK
jgi:hypothetical protein